jgi:hypothetical protein
MTKMERKATPVKTQVRWASLLSIVVVVLAFTLIRPDWLARFVSTLLLWLFVAVILAFYGLHPRSDFLDVRGKLAHAGERTQRNAQRVLRSLVLILAISLFYGIAPITQDCLQLARQGFSYLSEFKGNIRENKSNFITPHFIEQTLYIAKEGENAESSYSAMFFSKVPRYNNAYWFLVAPKSKLILGWQAANFSTNQPTWK